MSNCLTASDVGQFGPSDCNLPRFKQAGQYAQESKYYADKSEAIYNELANNYDLNQLVQQAKDSAMAAKVSEIAAADSASLAKADADKVDAWVQDLSTADLVYISPLGGETTLQIPSTFTNVRTLYINGSRQTLGDTFSFDPATHIVSFLGGNSLQAGDKVIVISSTIYEQISTVAQTLQSPGGADYVKTGDGNSVQQKLDQLKSIPSYEDLKKYTPIEVGQKVSLISYKKGSRFGGGEFISRAGIGVEDGGVICVPNNSTTVYWERLFDGNRVHVDWFGADPTGNEYSSDAIRNAFASSSFISMQGSYKYGGDSIDKGDFDLQGNGSTITFDDGVTFVKCTGTVRRPWAQDLYLKKGKSYFDFSEATANSYTDIRGFFNINMHQYTGTAIHLPKLDCPWWRVENCMFAGVNSTGTIGLWDNGSDNNIVRGNDFYSNQIHISTRCGSGTYLIDSNDFGQFTAGPSNINRANIWIRVPSTNPTFTGITAMFIVSNNKFGIENERELDVKLLLANEAADGFPSYSTTDGGLVSSHFIFSKNFYMSSNQYATNWMRSVGGWMPTTFSLEDENLQYSNKAGNYFCFVDHTTRYKPYKIYLKRKAHRDSDILWHGPVSNDPNIFFTLIDPSFEITAGDPLCHSPYSGGIGNGTLDITKEKLPNITYAGTASIQPTTDFLGNTEAIKASFSGRYGNIFQKLETVPTTQPGYIQGEIMIDNSSTFDEAIYLLNYSANTQNQNVYYQFPLQLKKGVWTSYCFPVMFTGNNSTHVLVLAPSYQDQTSYPNTVVWSRSRAYLGKTPGLVGTQRIGSLILSEVPTSSSGLVSGSIWRDAANGNVLKIVP